MELQIILFTFFLRIDTNGSPRFRTWLRKVKNKEHNGLGPHLAVYYDRKSAVLEIPNICIGPDSSHQANIEPDSKTPSPYHLSSAKKALLNIPYISHCCTHGID